MSYNTATERARDYDAEDHTPPRDHAEQGQRNDRIPFTKQDTADMSSTGNDEITVTQRMVSATIGSVLTSLLVTPLDVVRVRLQSQNPPTPPPLNISRFSAHGVDFAKLPKDLGVKACCKEVFLLEIMPSSVWLGTAMPRLMLRLRPRQIVQLKRRSGGL